MQDDQNIKDMTAQDQTTEVSGDQIVADQPQDQEPASEIEQTPSEPETTEDEQVETSEETQTPAPMEEPTVDESENTPVEETAEEIQEETTEQPTADETINPSEEAETTEAEEQPEEEKEPAKSDNPNAKWYVVHTYSGHENKVAATLKQRIESERLEDKIIDVLVPMQDKIEIKGGKKATIKEKIFPGYILVKMVLEDNTWLAVRTIQGVTSFVGIGNKPTPISDAEVQTIVKFTQTEQPVYKQVFTLSDAVKIIEGPFADFIGKVDSIDEERGKVKVLVSIFGRETPVELDFLQVQKI